MEKAIEIKNVFKAFKNIKALENVNLTVNEGEFLTLLGENGAGKTTLIKIICSLVKASSGSVRIFGSDIAKEKEKVSEMINVSPQDTAVSNNLTVKENLRFICDIYGVKKEEKEKRVNEILKELKLSEVENQKAKTLSGGYKRRLSIALALISKPKILFLDEPTLGLDVKIRRELWHVIKELKGKITIILTTHYLEEAEALADRVVIMEKGKIIEEGSIKEIEEKTDTTNLEDAFMKLVGGDDL